MIDLLLDRGYSKLGDEDKQEIELLLVTYENDSEEVEETEL